MALHIMDCYRLLGITPSASLHDMKTAYRQLARRYHPDVNPNDQQAQDKFIQITEAYDVLMRLIAVNPDWVAMARAGSVSTATTASAATASTTASSPTARRPQPPTQTQPPPAQPPPVQAPPPPKPSKAESPEPPESPERPSSIEANQHAQPQPAVSPPQQHQPELHRPAHAAVADQVAQASPTSPSSAERDWQLKQASYQQLQELLRQKRFPKATALIEGLAKRLPEDTEVRQWQAITYQSWGRHLISEKKLDKARALLKKALHTDPHNRSLWSEVERDFRRLDRML
jgi:hypothetical protein